MHSGDALYLRKTESSSDNDNLEAKFLSTKVSPTSFFVGQVPLSTVNLSLFSCASSFILIGSLAGCK